MTRPPEPDCPRWTVQKAALTRMQRVGKGQLGKRAAVHAWTCPKCIGWECPTNLPRDPERSTRG